MKTYNGSHIYKQVPTSKFIHLVYQIASRLSKPQRLAKNNQGFNEAQRLFHEVVYKLVRKMALDHPYHCIYQIFGLFNVDKIMTKKGKSSGYEANQDKKRAAESLLAEMKRSKHRDLVYTTEQLIESYLSLAKYGSTCSKKTMTIGLRDKRLLRIPNIQNLPVPTQDLKVLPDGGYNDRDRWDAKMIGTFSDLAKFSESGITRPIILDLTCHDGQHHRQLLKPEDDLRQDAVMEQVFDLVNQLLKKSASARERNLYIRTYRVVPLTPTVGMVEWVLNTKPIGIYFNEAHAKHNRKRMQPHAARAKYMSAIKTSRSKDVLLKAYLHVTKQLRPVMHHFFLENYPLPSDWFEAKLQYTRSVAVTSMIGYILGLGDRHTQNILIDQTTAELVHIDLGVAFDQGKLLKTPEIVPFRLTREIVDGMGVQGTDGTFRRCSVEVMKVLRQNQQMLLTVLEVFIHDPLYKWAVSPEKLHRLQRDDAEDGMLSGRIMRDQKDVKSQMGNKQAMRALFILKQNFKEWKVERC